MRQKVRGQMKTSNIELTTCLYSGCKKSVDTTKTCGSSQSEGHNQHSCTTGALPKVFCQQHRLRCVDTMPKAA